MISLSFAIVSILRFYANLKSHMQEHKPLLKLLAFKMVVGLVFIEQVRYTAMYLFHMHQTDKAEQIIFMILHSTDALKESSTMSYADVYIGLPTMIICIQMVPFALFFNYAYSTKPYRMSSSARNGNSQEYLAVEENEAIRNYKSRQYQGGPLGAYAWLAFLNAVEFFREITSTYHMFQEGQVRMGNAMVSQESYQMQYPM